MNSDEKYFKINIGDPDIGPGFFIRSLNDKSNFCWIDTLRKMHKTSISHIYVI